MRYLGIYIVRGSDSALDSCTPSYLIDDIRSVCTSSLLFIRCVSYAFHFWYIYNRSVLLSCFFFRALLFASYRIVDMFYFSLISESRALFVSIALNFRISDALISTTGNSIS